MGFQEIFESAPWNFKMESIRVLRGLSKKELADKVGTDIWLYRQWAKGKHYPITNNRKAICHALGVPEEIVFG